MFLGAVIPSEAALLAAESRDLVFPGPATRWNSAELKILRLRARQNRKICGSGGPFAQDDNLVGE
jgi:hypothetical protein